MRLLRGCAFLLVAAAAVAIAPAARAQRPAPHVGYVYPAGARQGTSIEIVVGGQSLDGVAAATVCGPGVAAKVLRYARPMTPQEANQLRTRVEELQKKDRDAAVTKELMEIRRKLMAFVRRPNNPAIAETVTLEVTLAADAEPGQRELRLASPAGLTNPLAFCVGQLPEFAKTSAAKAREEAVNEQPAPKRKEPAAAPATSQDVSLPAVVNGQIMPGGVDRWRFKARKGQRLVVAASARELIPYLADAVPGWFQAALTLYDADGKELAYADHYQFHPDPVLLCEIPADGQYTVEIRDSIYRGRDDFVYRIAMGELPFLTSIFPLGGKAGGQIPLELRGWNLPAATAVYDARGQQPGVHWFFVRGKEGISNRLPFALDALPECRQREPNGRPDEAQPVTLPGVVNGRIDRPGDWDVFRFEGFSGEQVVAEVYARRLDSPLDSVLRLCDAAGRQLAFNDDYEDKASGLETHHADSYLSATLPAAGAYYLYIGDVQHHGGPEYAYRLRISRPQPDFALRVTPSSINIRGSASAVVTVHALRRDGFSGEIALALAGGPAGLTLAGGRVPAGADQVRVTLSLPPAAAQEPLGLRLEGRAEIRGRQVVRQAVPAEDMMQAFAYRHLVPAQQWMLWASGRPAIRAALAILGPSPVKIPAGGTARVAFRVPGPAFLQRAQLDLDDPPDGIRLRDVAASAGTAELVLTADAAKIKPGLKGNLIVNAFLVPRPQANGKAKPQANGQRTLLGPLPAIPFEVVAP
jgi:hypothetical protein